MMKESDKHLASIMVALYKLHERELCGHTAIGHCVAFAEHSPAQERINQCDDSTDDSVDDQESRQCNYFAKRLSTRGSLADSWA